MYEFDFSHENLRFLQLLKVDCPSWNLDVTNIFNDIRIYYIKNIIEFQTLPFETIKHIHEIHIYHIFTNLFTYLSLHQVYFAVFLMIFKKEEYYLSWFLLQNKISKTQSNSVEEDAQYVETIRFCIWFLN